MYAAPHDEPGLDLDLTCQGRVEVVFDVRVPAMQKLENTKPRKRKRRTEERLIRSWHNTDESSRQSLQLRMDKSARKDSSRTLDEQALERVLQEASLGFSRRASTQADLDERSRGIAVLVLMKNAFRLSPSTFVLSVSLYDRFLDTYQCDRLASVSTTPKRASSVGQLPWDTPGTSENRRDLRPSAAGMKRVCAPLACLVMANKFIDVFAMRLSDLVMSAQQIFCAQSDADESTNSGAFSLYERWLVHEIRTEDLREWEQIVWETLGYRLDHVTALDVLHALLQCMATPMRRLIEDTSELKVQAAVCCPSFRNYSPVDLVTASLLNTVSELSVSDAQAVKDQICRAIPGFRITQDVRSCQALLGLLHVTV
jgi:hypothetical protein